VEDGTVNSNRREFLKTAIGFTIAPSLPKPKTPAEQLLEFINGPLTEHIDSQIITAFTMGIVFPEAEIRRLCGLREPWNRTSIE
jgi:hypothetical protein